MPHADFIHLHVHSAYSLSEGAIKIKELIKLCQRHNMPAVAMTDSNSLFGALEFAMAAREAGIQPIVGSVVSLIGAEPAANGRGGLNGNGNGVPKVPAMEPLVLLAQNEIGYRNLLKLMTAAHLERPEQLAPHVALDHLAADGEGLICLTGGLDGPVGQRLLERKDAEAAALLDALAAIFPGRLYVELQRHGQDGERSVEGRLLDLAYEKDLPLVATNAVYFPDSDFYEAHDVLLCIAESSYLADRDRRRLTPQHYFKSAKEMRALFQDLPEAVDNSLVVAQRCAFFPEKQQPILPPFETAAGRDEGEELAAQAKAGLEKRLDAHVFAAEDDEAERARKAEPYWQRLDYELGVIAQMGFPGYFLIVADFIQWSKANGIPVGPGRGSGAGSVVAWSLTITDLDPLRWNLLFERFLNPERISMPDFDIDFCQDRRDEVLRYVQEKYGRDRMAQIITFGKLQARAVLRDVGRVLQMPYGQVDRICKQVPNNPADPKTLQEALDSEEGLRAERDNDPDVARLIGIGQQLEGLYRHASTHAAGVVIGDRPLDELVPLYRDPRSEMPVTQFNMKYVELAGLVKFDFLGLKTLSVLRKAVELIAERGHDIELSSLPLDDEKTYAMLARGETVGVFQLESSGMRDVLRKLKADRFEDIIAVVALYRPGPMDNIPAYIERKHGREDPDYLHPKLKPLLEETYGIIIYQEQVLQIAQVLSGYSLGKADILRKAMGKKIKEEMDKQRDDFVDGAVELGTKKEKASYIFDLVAKFAGYGFNRAHAACYALLAYQTAYLKANHPVEFMAATMTYDMGNTDKLGMFRQELQQLGVPLLPPDVNHSRADFSVEVLGEASGEGEGAVRYALGALKNVGAAAMDGLVEERERGGTFASLADFGLRIDSRLLNRRMIEQLAAAGSFDGLMTNRRRVCEGADRLLALAARASEEKTSNQSNLFGDAQESCETELLLRDCEDWPSAERLQREYDAIGFYLTAHPLDAYDAALGRLKVLGSGELIEAARDINGPKKLAGVVLNRQERRSRKGNRFAFVQLSDSQGIYEVMVFSELLAQKRELLQPGRLVLVSVSLEAQADADMRLTAQGFRDLDEAIANDSRGLRLFLREDGCLPALRGVLDRQRQGQGRVNLVLETEGGVVEIALPPVYQLSPAGRQAIKSVSGVVMEEL